MSFLTNIKLGNVTNLSDARYAAAVGIQYIGFCFDRSNENYIAPIKAKEMIDWITGSNIVAEFGDQTLNEIRDISELLNIDVVELNNRILPDELVGFEKSVIKKIDADLYSYEQIEKEIEAYKPVCDSFLLFSSGNQNIDPEALKELCSKHKIIFGFEISTENVIGIINNFKPYAINISGGVEEKAGIKDFDELNDLLEIVTIEE